MKALSQFTYWFAVIVSFVGWPICLFVFLGAHRPDISSVSEETMRHVLPIPGAIILLSLISLVTGRHNGEGKFQRQMRGWSVGMILISLLMILLLFTESPY
ncbi:MAG: hypothetical protein AAGD22_07700 [Verrucomicrobiota bacterium]